jgi:hypothetical protein
MKTIALVVGNSSYPANELPNPIHDADSISLKFTELGINCILVKNVTKIQFSDSVKEFDKQLKDYEACIFFYAGHGMQIEGENYLCAIDTDFTSEDYAKYTSIPLNLVIDVIKKSQLYVKLFILDACRNNPYERNFRSTYIRGLASMYAPLGTLIAFATSPGETASDGTGNNGAFTESLLKHIGEQDLKVEDVFKRTRSTLYAITNGKQLSWEHTSLMGDFFFSTSQLTGGFSSSYNINALCDENFDLSDDKPIIAIIRHLKSYDWYKQNPAISLIKSAILADGNINEIFVLGRNIYQAACGNAWSAIEYIQNIRANLSLFTDEIQYHLLNGLIFEIYFDSSGKLRRDFKYYYIDNLIPMLIDEKYKENGYFLKRKLDDFDFRVIYDVTGKTSNVFNVIAEKIGDTQYVIKEIRINNRNILYNLIGSDEYQVNGFETVMSREKIQNTIASTIGGPSSKMHIIYVGVPDDINEIKFPYSYSLLNYRIMQKEENGA